MKVHEPRSIRFLSILMVATGSLFFWSSNAEAEFFFAHWAAFSSLGVLSLNLGGFLLSRKLPAETSPIAILTPLIAGNLLIAATIIVHQAFIHFWEILLNENASYGFFIKLGFLMFYFAINLLVFSMSGSILQNGNPLSKNTLWNGLALIVILIVTTIMFSIQPVREWLALPSTVGC